MSILDVDQIRSRFPALDRHVGEKPAVYFDGPGGSQTPQAVIDAIGGVLSRGISNLGGRFAASDFAEEVVDGARQAARDYLGVPTGGEVAFGPSMTALTMIAAEALTPIMTEGDEIVVTRLDHDANISPWLFLAERTGAVIRWVDFDPEDECRLGDVSVGPRTKLVAITHASNALGVIPDVTAACRAAREVGAISYVDAVHHAAHSPVDMGKLDADFVAASAYKFCGPHVGVLAMGPRVAHSVRPVHIRPVTPESPGWWERGTPSFEALAGVTAAVDYLASLGEGSSRRDRLIESGRLTHAVTTNLVRRTFAGIEEMPGVSVIGPGAGGARTPTLGVHVEGVHPATTAARLAEEGIFVWSGHNYALEVMRRLGKLESGGLVRVGFMHYNTEREVDRLLAVLDRVSTGG